MINADINTEENALINYNGFNGKSKIQNLARIYFNFYGLEPSN
jgi:hypothetical protein